MSFLSWNYALLLLSVFVLYWGLPWRGRMVLLLLSSYLFYGVWDVRFLALLMTSTAIDFYCCLGIAHQRRPLWQVLVSSSTPFLWLLLCRIVMPAERAITDGILVIALVFAPVFSAVYWLPWKYGADRRAKAFMVISIVTNLSVLVSFKYFNFFAESLLAISGKLGLSLGLVLPHIILPVGISFYTFQSISYAVDCHKGKAKPCEDLLTFAAYLSFFPQLVAGPIERANDLLPQFVKPVAWSAGMFHEGLRLILIGMFKKVFVGDSCAVVANYAFGPGADLNGPWALLGAVAFAFQIYGDFSGYTDIARGSAALLGIRLNRNFLFPYFAVSPTDFWRRWHVTLSSWFRDYFYIPLGGNRSGTVRMCFNLWLTMVLAGLWHGAYWTFLLWGAYHGFLLIAYRFVPPLRWLAARDRGAGSFPSVLVMFLFTLFGWILFRVNSLGQLEAFTLAFTHWPAAAFGATLKPALWCLLHAIPLFLWQLGTLQTLDEAANQSWKWPVRAFAYALAFVAIATSNTGDTQFIYFQF